MSINIIESVLNWLEEPHLNDAEQRGRYAIMHDIHSKLPLKTGHGRNVYIRIGDPAVRCLPEQLIRYANVDCLSLNFSNSHDLKSLPPRLIVSSKPVTTVLDFTNCENLTDVAPFLRRYAMDVYPNAVHVIGCHVGFDWRYLNAQGLFQYQNLSFATR